MTEPTSQTSTPASLTLDPVVTERCVRAIAALGELRGVLPNAPAFDQAVDGAQAAVIEWAAAYVRSANARAATPVPPPTAPAPPAEAKPAAKPESKGEAKPDAKAEAKPTSAKPADPTVGGVSSEEAGAARPDPFAVLR